MEDNEDLLSNISKGSLEFSLDSNAPDTEKMIILLRQELSDLNVELKVCITVFRMSYICLENRAKIIRPFLLEKSRNHSWFTSTNCIGADPLP